MMANNLVGDIRFGYDRKSFTHQPRTIYDPSEGTMECYWDAIGKPIQYIHYAPYGELIDNQRTIVPFWRYKPNPPIYQQLLIERDSIIQSKNKL